MLEHPSQKSVVEPKAKACFDGLFGVPDKATHFKCLTTYMRISHGTIQLHLRLIDASYRQKEVKERSRAH